MSPAPDFCGSTLWIITSGLREKYGIPDGLMELEVTETGLGGEELPASWSANCRRADSPAPWTTSGYRLLFPEPEESSDPVLKLGHPVFPAERGQGPARRIVVRNIINMARELKIRVIAEGRGGWRRGISARGGCDIVQGYVFYAGPMPLAEFGALLAETAGR